MRKGTAYCVRGSFNDCGARHSGGEPPQVDTLTIFGLFAVTAMMTFYALEDRNPWFILAFAGSCILGSVYGFLQGAWPFGIVEAVWSIVAARRWWRARRMREPRPAC
jgi:hypothetical protein